MTSTIPTHVSASTNTGVPLPAYTPVHLPRAAPPAVASSSGDSIPGVVPPATVAPSTADTTTVSTSAPVSSAARRTRLQCGIRKTKFLSDRTVRYGNLVISAEPHNLANAISDPNWKSAMKPEFSGLLHNKTWHLVPPVPDRNLIDCKWVYKVKHKADSSVDRYKARLVAEGFR
jgi:hypothetical protein